MQCLDKKSEVLEKCSIKNRVFNFDLKMLRLDDNVMLPGRSFHIVGPDTEKARDFITDEVVKGTQSKCLSLERRLRDGT